MLASTLEVNKLSLSLCPFIWFYQGSSVPSQLYALPVFSIFSASMRLIRKFTECSVVNNLSVGTFLWYGRERSVLTVPGCKDTHTTWKERKQVHQVLKCPDMKIRQQMVQVRRVQDRKISGIFTWGNAPRGNYLGSTAAQLYRQIPGGHVESCLRHPVAVPTPKTWKKKVGWREVRLENLWSIIFIYTLLLSLPRIFWFPF